jgi:hypothetical protein
MRMQTLAGLVAAAILLAPAIGPRRALTALAGAQGGGAQDGVKPGKVYLTGEHPEIRLLDKAGGKVLTSVSYWRVVWSPVGPGHVCYVSTTTGPKSGTDPKSGDGRSASDGKTASDVRVALTDNRKLYDYLTENIMAPVLDRAIAERPYAPVAATFDDPGRGTFNTAGDVMTERRITARANKYTVVLVWHDFGEPFQADTQVGGAANPFGVTSLVVPARTATVFINGAHAAGNVYREMRGGAASSSAFLAYSESWVK